VVRLTRGASCHHRCDAVNDLATGQVGARPPDPQRGRSADGGPMGCRLRRANVAAVRGGGAGRPSPPSGDRGSSGLLTRRAADRAGPCLVRRRARRGPRGGRSRGDRGRSCRPACCWHGAHGGTRWGCPGIRGAGTQPGWIARGGRRDRPRGWMGGGRRLDRSSSRSSAAPASATSVRRSRRGDQRARRPDPRVVIGAAASARPARARG
jgi:hypothetical protein